MTGTPEKHDERGWVPDDGTFGARLALVRQRMGWGNVKEAAIACGLPVESWRSWERDGRTPQRIVETAALIAERTGCDYGWLLAGGRLRNRPNGGSVTEATTR
ncbi:helix-turn-helix transcriptional regulator [Micromonospora sp. WMMD1076]|uniref:helix-turn-helix domain-containing protein n=1 Tax=Micromonospora sp. WMMD1076 TaxID=3016103 RepID=UPI00249B8841|nr:helix-turn-helix transcriptional regulator [Micromonospora sp. WMMD1076]WFF07218.1 helix-turn-helix transcriptional regulator [Micromonospora sp. WMMD1076]